MQDGKTVSLTCVIAIAFWVISAVFICTELVALIFTEERWLYVLGHAGIACSMVGATLTIKSFYARLAHRMDEAFALGREVGRAEAPGVRSVR